MTGNSHVRFGGRPTEKAPLGDLAGGRSHWKPIWNLLEARFELLLANAHPLKAVPGRTAEVILAELGTDMGRFPTAGQAASWAGMAPGNNESAGKRKSGKTRKGNPALRTVLAEAAKAAGRTKNTYLSAQYRRLAPGRGKNKATIAVGHTILVIAYHVLKRSVGYEDLGPNYFDERDRKVVERRLIRRIEALGYKVTPKQDAA